MVESGIPELTLDQVTELCEGAENAARKYVLSKISTNKISTIDISVNAEGTKPLTLNVEVNVVLSPLMKDFDVEQLTAESTKRAFAYIEKYLMELKCKSKKY